MKRNRRIIAMIMLIALTICSTIVYSKTADVSASGDEYNWTHVSAAGFNDFYFCVVENDIGGNLEWLDNGLTMQVAYSATYTASSTQVFVNDEEQQAGGTYLNIKADGLSKFFAQNIPLNEITLIRIESNGDTYEIAVKRESDPVAPTSVTASAIASTPGAATVSWTQGSSVPSGQTYSIYVDGELFRSDIDQSLSSKTINNLDEGTHTIAVAGAVGRKESEHVEASSTVTIASKVKYSPDIAIEGFQIRSNYDELQPAPTTVAFRTMCKAPKSTVTVDGTTYTIASYGTSYAIDNNTNGYDVNNQQDASYTLLNETPVTGQRYSYVGLRDSSRTFGYLATGNGIISDWKPADTKNTYYAFTMQNMDDNLKNTLWIRPFVVSTTGTIIYGKITRYTSVAEIANHIYTRSMSKNVTAHNYLYNNICAHAKTAGNRYHLVAPVDYGWNTNLYDGFRLVPDSYTGGVIDEMQYVTVGDYSVHATSYFARPAEDVKGASASYKGHSNEEMAVMVNEPGASMWYGDYTQAWINWGIQIKLLNAKAYKYLENGKYYRMTILYKSTNAGNMWIKREGQCIDNQHQEENMPYMGGDAYPRKYPAVAGYNTINVDFLYAKDRYMNQPGDCSIVFSLGGGMGQDMTEQAGFPKGTIISDVDISFTEITPPTP